MIFCKKIEAKRTLLRRAAASTNSHEFGTIFPSPQNAKKRFWRIERYSAPAIFRPQSGNPKNPAVLETPQSASRARGCFDERFAFGETFVSQIDTMKKDTQ